MIREISDNDILQWADGTWCYRRELDTMTYMSDDFVVIPYESYEWEEFHHD
jgi:hypothetical protein